MNPLWRAAPLVLRRYPGVLAALVAASTLLALAAAAGPLFVSASASAAVADELRRLTGFGAGAYVRVTGPVAPEDVEARGEPTFAERTAALERATAGLPARGKVVATILGPEIDAAGRAGPDAGDLEVRLLARTDALEHVRRLEGGGPGLWVADTAAEQLGLEPGDRIRLGLGTTERTAAVRVAGVYRSLALEPRTPFWRSLAAEIYSAPPAFATLPTFAIGAEATVTGVAVRLGLERADFRWEIPVESRVLSSGEAERVAQDFEALGTALADVDDPLFELFVCRRCVSGIRAEFSTGMPGAVETARASAATVRGPVDVLANAGSLVALVVVGAVGAFALARRRVEVVALFARGAGPGSAGARLALEALLPVLAGTALGVGAAYLLVAVLGPDGAIDRDGLGDGLGAAAVRAPVALVLLGVVGAAGTARLERAGAAAAHNRRLPFPWEWASLVLAGLCLAGLITGEAFTETGEAGVARPSSYLLLFPIFLLAGVAGLGARLLLRTVGAWRDRSARSSSEAVYLATHRLASARVVLTLLVTAAALALGMFAYAEAVVASYRSTVHAASLLGTGSDVSGFTSYGREIPDLPVPVTKATKLTGEGFRLGSLPVDILAIDSETFPEAVHWDDSYAARPLEAIAADLGAGGVPVPAALVGGSLEGVQSLTAGDWATSVRVVERPRAFPGMSVRDATLVVDAAAFEAVADGAGLAASLTSSSARTELWAKGETERTLRLLDTSPARPFPLVTAEEARRRPETVAFTRTFAFLEALGLAAGLLALVGLVVYLHVRQRARAVAFGLAGRMGLSARSHRRALALELGLSVAAAFALGLGTALAAARLVLTEVEPLASISPVPVFEPPLVEAGAALLVLGAVTLAGAALAHRAARRANVAEILRLGE